MSMNDKIFERVFQRLDALESRVAELETKLEPVKTHVKTVSLTSNFKKLNSGIHKLIHDGFFNEPELVKDVKSELERQGYYYIISAVNKALYVDFMKKKNLLTRIGKRGEWKYVIRK